MKASLEKVSAPGQSSFLYKRRSDPRFEFLWHFHPEYELTLIVNSRGKRFIGDSIADYGDGDLVLLGRDLPHTWCSDPDPPRRRRRSGRGTRHRAIVIQFAEDFLGPEFLSRPELASIARLMRRASQGIRFSGRTQKLVAARMDEMEAQEGFERLKGLLEILETLARSRDGVLLASRGFSPSLREADRQRIDRVLRFLNQNYRRSIFLDEAAEVAHLSAAAFSRFFRKTAGKTFTAYVNELRVAQACRFLIETDRNIAAVALDCGFENLSNFNRRFQELKKMSPREFRREFAEPLEPAARVPRKRPGREPRMAASPRRPRYPQPGC